MLRKIVFFTVFLTCAFFSQAQVIVTGTTERISIGKSLSVLKEKEPLDIAEVVKSGEFTRINKDVPNLGISEGSLWLKFSIINKTATAEKLLEIAYPILDEVEFFEQDKVTGSYKGKMRGQVHHFSSRSYKHPNYIFKLDLPKDSVKTFYLRVKSSEQVILPITINTPAALSESLNRENLLIGIFIGVVLIMLVYNLFVYFSVKDKSYLYYVFYVLFVGLTQVGIKGINYQFLWPDSPDFEIKSVVFFASISGAAGLLFAKSFLQTKLNAKNYDWLLVFLVSLFAAACILTIVGHIRLGFQVMQGTTTLLTITILWVSYLVMRKGYAPAKFFFAAWSVLLSGATIFLLKDYGLLPYNAFTSYSMQASSAIEMALLSFGLADRINILKREKEESQVQALRIAEENERIIREQNVILEQRVAERTVELEKSNEDLNKTLDDLKQAQSQLVESEKMASLGQLTAGIAHEINNPINFVTSNVTPLRRDVDMLIDTLETIERLGLTEESIEQKRKQIDAYKEEMDFDYLKTEINYLLKGIYEGASRTAEIVKGLRIFSRVDEDDLKRADVNQGIDSTLIIVNNLLGKVKVEKELQELPLIECFPGKLNQVFLNIITNAIHAINAKHHENSTGILFIKSWATSDNVYISIKDNGTGMEENTVKKIFEPFFTTKDVGEGTGLGMSIAYNTIKKHNGHIIVNSILGEGTEFIIELPLIHQLTTT